MTRNEILAIILPSLIDEFEAGNKHGRTFSPSSAEEYEPLRECLAAMIAEGSLTREHGKIYRLTNAGYSK